MVDATKKYHLCILKAIKDTDGEIDFLVVEPSNLNPGQVHASIGTNMSCVDTIHEYTKLAGFKLIKSRVIDRRDRATVYIWVRPPS